MYVEMRPAGRIFFACIPNGLLVGPRTSACEKVRSFHAGMRCPQQFALG